MSGTMNCSKVERYYELLYYMPCVQMANIGPKLNILINNRQIKSITSLHMANIGPKT